MMRMLLVSLCGAGAACFVAGAPAAALPPATRTVDPAAMPMPNLTFNPNPGTIRNYAHYFYFQRDETDFATALADLRECDHYGRNISIRITGSYAQTPYPYQGTMAGALGGAVANVLIASITDSTEGLAARRRIQRINMRRCMTFKGYRTYGLPRNVWQTINFEESGDPVPESRRQRFLQIQARIASGPRPTVGEMSE